MICVYGYEKYGNFLAESEANSTSLKNSSTVLLENSTVSNSSLEKLSNSTETSTEASTETSTEASNETSTESSTEASTEALTEATEDTLSFIAKSSSSEMLTLSETSTTSGKPKTEEKNLNFSYPPEHWIRYIEYKPRSIHIYMAGSGFV